MSIHNRLGNELTLLREELIRLEHEQSGLMDMLDGQRLQVDDLEQQLQQLYRQEQELKTALSTYEKNISIIQPSEV